MIGTGAVPGSVGSVNELIGRSRLSKKELVLRNERTDLIAITLPVYNLEGKEVSSVRA